MPTHLALLRRFCLPVWIGLLWLGPLQDVRAQPPTRYAILVGVNKYQHDRLPSLNYAVNDVVGLAQVLGQSGYQVQLLCDTTGERNAQLAPTKANIERHRKTTLQKCRKGDSVLMAFAGHGLQFEGQKDSFFCPSDARPFADRTDSLVSLGKIYEELDASFASVKIMLVDACRNDPRGGRGSRGIDADTAPRPPRGVAALFSCSAGQSAYEDTRLKHGVFFYFVLQGLRGEARDTDGDVTFDNLSSYVRKQVSREVPKMYGPEAQQSPNLKADLSGESPLLLHPRIAGTSTKPPGDGKNGPTSVSKGKVESPSSAGTWSQIGPAGAWRNTLAGTILDGRLYTVETNGYLYRTDLGSGAWEGLGKPEYAGTALLFAVGPSLCAIQSTGDLWIINPRDGTRSRVGPATGWKDTLVGAAWKGHLYTVEASGCLYRTDVSAGSWIQIGKAEFANTIALFAFGDSLYSIEKSGNLYRINPSDGTWVQIGAGGDWRSVIAGSPLKGHFYNVKENGCLYQTDLGTGKSHQLGKQEFAGTRGMWPAGDRLITIEKEGSLYLVNVQ